MKKWKVILLVIVFSVIPIGVFLSEAIPKAIQKHRPQIIKDEVTPNWGVTLTAKNVTPEGLTILCTQSDGEPTGELNTGSYYTIHKLTEDGWIAVDYLPHEYDIGWTLEAWLIPMNDTVEWQVNWEWLYGKLPSGHYRIGKGITGLRVAGDYNQVMFYADFDIE